MLNIIVMLANIGVSFLTYHYLTHNITASVVGFICGMSFWFLIRD